MHARTAALVLGLAGCGRIGYDAAGVTGDDADVDTPPVTGIVAACNTPVRVGALPPPVDGPILGLDITGTTTGFVAAWPTRDDVYTLALSVYPPDYRIEIIQSGASLLGIAEPGHVSIAALGDDVVVGIDSPLAGDVVFAPADAYGYERDDAKAQEDVAAGGGDFLVAVPAADPPAFAVAGFTPTDTVIYGRNLIGEGIDGAYAVAVPSTVPEVASVTVTDDGYAVIAGLDHCDVSWISPTGAVTGPQTVDMTCHHATLLPLTGASRRAVVAAWNCDNDQVWFTAGSPEEPIPPETSVFGDATHVASQPRLVASADGIWYAFAVEPDQLGRTLLTTSGALDPRVPAAIVVPSGARFHALASHADAGFLFWLDTATTDLYTMRLCPS